MTRKDINSLTFKADFEADKTAQKYGDNALLLYALALHFGIEDLDEFAANALTDGGNDKKLDICHIDEPKGVITLAQGYHSKKWGKSEAPANKASALNTSAAWVFSADLDSIPEKLRTKVVESRDAIADGVISRIDIVYVHNCFEGQNVARELTTVAAGIRDILRGSGNSEITVTFKEVGLLTIEEWFSMRDAEILIDGWIDLPSVPYIEEKGEKWRGIALTIPGSWVRDLHVKHNDKLFSANFRDYLGVTNSKGNINSKIKATVADEPENFWIYNNGITALTREIDTKSQPPRIRGISIINGAQTSGALGESTAERTSETRLLLRIMEAKSESLISYAILYTNTQNEIKPFDIKSNDPFQAKLKDGLAKYGLQYIHRRSKARPRSSLTASGLGAALCAFHGDPQTAYRNSRDIFSRDETYAFVFRDVTPEHAYLLHTLSSAIDERKLYLKTRVSEDKATQTEIAQYQILQFSPSKHFLLYIFGAIAEQILNRRISNLKTWKVKKANVSTNTKRIMNAWRGVLEVVLPHLASIMGKDSAKIYEIQRSNPKSTDQPKPGAKDVAENLSTTLSALESVYATKFKDIRAITTN